MGGPEGKFMKEAATCQAKAMDHNQMASTHRDTMYGYNQPQGRSLPVEEKAKHIMAASAHSSAADHYHAAADSFNQGLPMSGKERMKMGEEHGAKANALTAKCDMGNMGKAMMRSMNKAETRDGEWKEHMGTQVFVDKKSGRAIDGDQIAVASYNKVKEHNDKNIDRMNVQGDQMKPAGHKA